MQRLNKKNIQDILALTPMQEGMLFHFLKEPENELYLEQLSLDISGEIDIHLFEKAWDFVIQANEMLRAVFRWEKVEKPIQIILNDYKLNPLYIDLSTSSLNVHQQLKQLEEIRRNDREKKFDLQDVPFRLILCKLEKEKYRMIISNHHILYDGWSTGIILKEFFKAYDDLVYGRELLKPVKSAFKEFVKWNRDRGRDSESEEKFWRNYLSGFEPQTDLPVNVKKRKRKKITSTGNYQVKLADDLKDKLERLVKSCNITAASLFYSVWGLLLQKINSSGDVIFDTTVSGRDAKIKGIENIVGLFINTLPLRVKVQDRTDETAVDFLSRTYRMLQQWSEFESSSLLHVNEFLDEHLHNKNGLFDSVVVIENYPLDSILIQKNSVLSVQSYSISGMTPYDLTVLITVFDDITLDFTYNNRLFDRETIKKLAGDVLSILKTIIENPHMKIFELLLLPGEMRDFTGETSADDYTEPYAAPRDLPEKKLAGIWAELYRVDKSEISIDTNFFDLGGHSLKAARLCAAIHKELGMKVSLAEVFRFPTIRKLAGYITQTTGDRDRHVPLIPVKPVENKEYHRLAPAQKRLYMLQQLNPDSTFYNGPLIMRLQGPVDNERIALAFKRLIRRHEILRTSFIQHNGEPVQVLHDEVEFEIKYLAAKAFTMRYKAKEREDLVGNFLRPFDLSKAPLLRVGLIGTGNLEHLLVIDMHHIITDGTSRDILTGEFVSLYKGETLPALNIQYKDFSGWQNERLLRGELKNHEDYWLKSLSGELPVLNLSVDFPRPVMQSFAGERISFELPGPLARQLHIMMKETGTTLYMVLMTVYSILLSWYGGQEDILVGVPVAGRNHADLADTVGLFLETLVIRNQPGGNKIFEHFLKEVKHTTLTADEHQDYPFSELVRQAAAAKMNDLSRNPLFDVMLNVLNQDSTDLEIEGVKIIPYSYDAGVSKVDITLEVVEKEERIELELEYCTALFKRETMERFVRYFLNALRDAVYNPEIRLGDMEIIAESEKRQILDEFNDTASEYADDEIFMKYFERQVKKKPDKIAVLAHGLKGREQNITYNELNKRARRLARLLRERGVQPNTIVGIMVDRSPWLIIGLLGILKAGGAYLPLDPAYPEDRLAYMLKDSNAKVLVITSTLAREVEKLRSWEVEKVLLEEVLETPESSSQPLNLSTSQLLSSSNLAYIIYTSGSTGRPKGVMVSHKNLTAYIHAFTREFEIRETDIVLQQASYCFDAFVEEVFPCLVKGGTLALPCEGEVRDTALLSRFIALHGVNMIDCSPMMLNELNSREQNRPGDTNPLHTIHTFISGGDVLKNEYIRNLLEIGSVYNTYGPTETTICATYHRVNQQDDLSGIPIGKPISNYRVYILDGYHRLLPLGVSGEIGISGVGITMGYLNQSELTAERFIEPQRAQRENFINKSSVSSVASVAKKFYKTGDLGKWLPDGSIEFLGRKDRQVSVRGFRIELGEIESQLLAHEDIDNAAIIAFGEKGNAICVYFTARTQKNVKEMKEFLSKKLPDYMIPAYFVQMEEFPLGPGGKINTKALPEPTGYSLDTGVEYTPPASEVESHVLGLWQELLGLERIGTMDDFFDLGGDSILANRCIAAIREEYNVEIPLRRFFEGPYITALAEEIEIGRQDRWAVSAPESISIGKAPKGVDIPLSFPQERLWFLQILDPGNKAYFVPRVFRIKGKLDVELLERTFTEIIRRHEILRTVFVTKEGEPVQHIQPPYDFKIPVMDWSGEQEPQQSREVSRWVKEEGQSPFDFEKGPLLRVTLLKLKEHEHLLVLTEHHLVHDGWTQGVLLKEFVTIFSAYLEGKHHGLPELPIQYADFAYWQRNYLQGEVLENHLNYWKQKLDGVVQVLELPGDRARPPMMSGRGALKDFHLSASLTQQLKDFSRKHGVTLFMTMLAVFKVLLYRYTGTGDLCVGTGIANRSYKEIEGLLGMVINTIPLRTQAPGGIHFVTFLHHVKETCLEAYQHQDTPFERIVEVMDPERSLSYNPIFQVMFSFMDTPTADLRLPGLELHLEPSHNRSSKFDLNIVVVPPLPPDQGREEAEGDGGETLVEWEYNTDIFDDSTMDRMLTHYMRLLEEIITLPGKEISALPMMDETEINQLLYGWNRTDTQYPKEKTLHELFEKQVERSPEGTALVGKKGKIHITYGVLNEKAGRLAHYLKEKGVLADSIVGIMVERSVEMIIGIFGILKAGGCYLPIDTQFPGERIAYMLKDSKTKVLLSEVSEICEVSGGIEVIDLPSLIVETEDAEPTHLTHLTHPTQLCYVIYTSGSTGKPKGVMIEHKNVVNFIHGIVSAINFSAGKTILALTTISFDIFVLETLLPLLNGLKIIMASKEEQKGPRLLAKVIIKNSVNMLQVTPSSLKLLLNHDADLACLEKVDVLMVGGESFPENLFEILKYKYSGKIYNMYGPTETTVWSTVKELTAEAEITIGSPIANTQIYIIDGCNNPQPVGVVGELCIGGDGLARGYVNRPGLTAEKFLSVSYRSYRSYRSYISKKIYKTGDLARWQSNGNIELIGRIDHQVKIRGFRIEPGEIESRLAKHKDINEAVVVCREDGSGDKYLCAYVVPHHQEYFRKEEVFAYLSESLPGYMVPSYIVILEAIPLNPSGKVDRKSLPEPAIRAGNNYAPPENEIEVKLVRLWSEILNLDEGAVGIDDNFFRLGGHSLKAVTLMNRIHEELSVEVPVTELFKTLTIRGIAGYIQHSGATPYSTIEPVEKKEYYALSSAQKRLYILQQMALDSTGYNMSHILPLKEDVDLERLEKAIRKLISRHESLRTSLQIVNEELFQKIHDEVEFEIEYFSVKQRAESADIIQDFIRPFDLSQAPLLRLGLIKIEEGKHLLMLDMHHIITDAASQSILTGELMTLYSHPGEELSPLQLQYKDYARWQNSSKQQELIKRQETYWLELFSDDLPILNLPFDYPRPALQSFAGSRIHFALDEEQTKHLKTIARRSGSTPYMMILAVFSILLSKLSGEEDIVIGTPTAGRLHPDTQKLIGMFVNTLAIRNYPKGDKTFLGYLEEVKKHTLEAYENQGYQFDQLVEKIPIRRDTSRNPVFDVIFNLLTQADYTGSISLLDEDSESSYENVTAKFDLNLTAIDLEETFSFSLEYCTKLFRKETIERFIRYFREIVTSVLLNTKQRIAEIEILTGSERLLLEEFNNTVSEYPKHKAIHELFAEQAVRTPGRMAATGRGQGAGGRVCHLSYGELNEKSDQLARILRGKGVQPDNIVGIMLENSVEMIIGVLGILKAGGAYLPIDPEYPQERIDYMLKDSGAKVLLNEGSEVLDLSLPPAPCPLRYALPPASLASPANLAYIIYTSGSTGSPKGVMVEHCSVVRLVKNTNYVQFREGDRILQTAPLAFDASTFEIWGALLNGLTFFLTSKEEILVPGTLKEMIYKYDITTIWMTSPLFNQMVQNDVVVFAGLGNLLVGGDVLSPPHIHRVKKRFPRLEIINGYGPTENTTFSTTFSIEEEYRENIPIGKPIANSVAYIVDKNERLQPIGVPGELYVGGDGVARGYLNNPELTKEKFISFSYRSYKSYISKKIYKTGDLARWLRDGNIEFLGRMDFQVKIRGFRIEPGEIESYLMSHDEIKEAVVLVREENKKEKYLCAYIVCAGNDMVPSPLELREYLSIGLPDYMIPSCFVVLEKIPLTANGKIDRKMLPKPEMKMVEEYEAPADKTEKLMAVLWSEALGIEENIIGLGSNFFELGGHSLKATQLVSSVRKAFNVKLPLAEIFKHPTVRELSAWLRKAAEHKYISIAPAELKDYYAVSSAQKRLYILQNMDEEGIRYNIPTIYQLEGCIDKERLERTFKRLIKRYESLRTSFVKVGGKPVQVVHDEVEFNIQQHTLPFGHPRRGVQRSAHNSQEGIIKDFIRPFDLAKAPLIRVGLTRTDNLEHILMVDMHHIITDGGSMGILIREFMRFYSFTDADEELPPFPIQYKDFSEWLNSEQQGKLIRKQEAYWLSEFEGEIPVLNLITDYPGGREQNFAGGVLNFKLGEKETFDLRQLAKKEDVTIYMLLLAIYNVLLSILSNQEEIIVGTPTAGRRHADLQPLIGMFVNTLALRNYPGENKTFREFLKEIKERTLAAFENQDYPFEDLAEKVADNRDASRNPLFDVMFTMQNLGLPELEIPGMRLKPYDYETPVSKFDLTLTGIETGDHIDFRFGYRASLFKEETIVDFANYYKGIIAIVLEDKDVKLSQIDLSGLLEVNVDENITQEINGEFEF